MSQEFDKEITEDVPLIKPKGQKVKKNIELEINKITPDEPIIEQVVAKVKKPRPPKTEAQKQQFQNVLKKRKELLDKAMLEKKIEASKLLLSQGLEIPKINNKVDVVEESSSDESEEEVIIVKRKPKKKKKIIYMSESSESDSDSDGNPPAHNHQKRNFITQQNKKSVIKVKNDYPTAHQNTFINCFAD
jgi:hypothetical protein